MLGCEKSHNNEATTSTSHSQFGTREKFPLSVYSWYDPLKAITDRFIAALLLGLTFPLIILAAIAVKLTSRGAIIYSQVRLGRGGKPFWIYKIRTMAQNCETQSGVQWSTPGDPRVTRVGRFLRKSHIDELPQLWNVLRGDMSLVGPRPERPEFVPQLDQAIGRYRERMRVRPGITGLAQVQLPPDTTLESVRRKLAHDLYYVEKMGFWLDLRILLSTGLHFLGLPYALMVRLFALPGGTPIESSYSLTLEKKTGQTKLGDTLVGSDTVVQPNEAVADLLPA